MNNVLKNKLKQNNIPINETQLNILFLMYANEKDINPDELLKMGNFALSSLLFNINNLQSTFFLEGKDCITQYNLKDNIHMSENGKALLERVDKLCANIYKNKDHRQSVDFYHQLIAYEQEVNKNIGK